MQNHSSINPSSFHLFNSTRACILESQTKMQRFGGRKILSETNSTISRRWHRCFAQLAQKQEATLSDNEVFLPKMPPFDYSPPPYTGPSADEILAKRKTYLSPSLFHFYSKPVSHFRSVHHWNFKLSRFHFSNSFLKFSFLQYFEWATLLKWTVKM